MDLPLKLHIYNFMPTAVQLALAEEQTFPIMGVHRGTWIQWIGIQGGYAFHASSSITVGDSDSHTGYTEALTGFGTSFFELYGPYLVRATRCYMYGCTYATGTITAINLYYTGPGEAATGRATVYVIYAQLPGEN